jgi:hypothetical protein
MRSFIICTVHQIKDKIGGHVARMGETEGKGTLGKPLRRREDNIRMYPKEIGWEGVNWMHLAQDRVCREHGNKTWGSMIGGEFPD